MITLPKGFFKQNIFKITTVFYKNSTIIFNYNLIERNGHDEYFPWLNSTHILRISFCYCRSYIFVAILIFFYFPNRSKVTQENRLCLDYIKFPTFLKNQFNKPEFVVHFLNLCMDENINKSRCIT